MIAPVSRHEWLDFEAYRPLVMACAKQFLRRTACAMTLDDLAQEAWLALYDASPHLWRVPEKDRVAYLSRAIRYTLIRVSKKNRPMETGVIDCVAKDHQATEFPLEKFTPSQRRLLKAHLGLNGRTPQTLKSLAAKWGCSVKTLSRNLASCRKRIIRDFDR